MKELVFTKRTFVCALGVALLALGPLGSAGALTNADSPKFHLDRGPLVAGVSVREQFPVIEGEVIVYQRQPIVAITPADDS